MKVWPLASFLIVLLLLGGGLVWIRIATVKDTYRYAEREKELHKVQQDVLQERVKWLQLTSPKNLAKLAEELQLSPPEINQFEHYERRKTKSAN